MKIIITTPHLLFAALVLAFAASTIWAQVHSPAQSAYAFAGHDAGASTPGFSGAFGNGAVVRNLLF